MQRLRGSSRCSKRDGPSAPPTSANACVGAQLPVQLARGSETNHDRASTFELGFPRSSRMPDLNFRTIDTHRRPQERSQPPCRIGRLCSRNATRPASHDHRSAHEKKQPKEKHTRAPTCPHFSSAIRGKGEDSPRRHEGRRAAVARDAQGGSKESGSTHDFSDKSKCVHEKRA